MYNKSCFFIGNSRTPSSVKGQLKAVLEKHIIEYGIMTFIVGHYGAFDRLVATVLKEVKSITPIYIKCIVINKFL